MEQADVPPSAERVEELHQRAGPFGELEAARPLVPHVGRAAAHHVTDVQLRQLVVRQIQRLVSRARSSARPAITASSFDVVADADEDVRAARGRRGGS